MRYRLRDLLATVAVITLLMGFAVPMLVARREASRKNQCQANLRQLVMSCVSYEVTYGSLPPAVVNFTDRNYWISTGKENGLTRAGPNWAASVLMQLNERPVQRQAVQCVDGRWKFNVADDIKPQKTPGYLICPAATRAKLPHSSVSTQLDDLEKGNYAACLGSGTYLESIDGSVELDELLQQGNPSSNTRPDGKRGVITVVIVPPPNPGPLWDPGLWQFGYGRGTKLRKIVDGKSKTVILSEVLAVDGKGSIASASDDIRGAWLTPSMGGSTYSHKTTPNSAVKDQINGCESDAKDLPPGSRLNCVQQPATGPTAGDTFAAARSEHVGGVMAAMADGSIKFYSNDINPDVWAALGTRAGGE